MSEEDAVTMSDSGDADRTLDVRGAEFGLRAFDPCSATPEQWSAYHAFRKEMHAERHPDRPPAPDADVEFRQRQAAEDEDWITGALHVHDGAAVIARAGWGAEADSSVDYASNGHLLWGVVNVLSAYRRRGIGRRLIESLCDVLVSLDRQVVTQWVELPSGQAFAERFGARVKQVMPEFELALAQVDWQKMDRWIADFSTRAPEYAAELIADRLPESTWPEYCASKTVLMNTSPRDDLDMGDWTFTVEELAEQDAARLQSGACHHNLLVRGGDGQIVAITDTVWKPSDPTVIRQHFTGVHPDHRGQGIGKYIKARMLRHLATRHADDGLESVRTGTAESNAAMRAINDRMGFVELSRAIVYQIEREALVEALSSD